VHTSAPKPAKKKTSAAEVPSFREKDARGTDAGTSASQSTSTLTGTDCHFCRNDARENQHYYRNRLSLLPKRCAREGCERDSRDRLMIASSRKPGSAKTAVMTRAIMTPRSS
jgi:hypothetical protein